MKRRSKIIATITTMCLALSMLVVGVLASTTVSFSIGGSVSYVVEDVYAKIHTRVFGYDQALNAETAQTKLNELSAKNLTELDADSTLKVVDSSLSKKYITYKDSGFDGYTVIEEVGGKQEGKLENIELSYNDYKTFFIVINVENMSSSNPISVLVNDTISNPSNTWQLNSGTLVKVSYGETNKHIIFAFGIENLSLAIDKQDGAVKYSITIQDGEIEAEGEPTLESLGFEFIETPSEPVVNTLSAGNSLPSISQYSSSTGYYAAYVKKDAEGEVIIPEVYNDGVNGDHYVLETVDRKFFYYHKEGWEEIGAGNKVTSIKLPDTIKTIGKNSFRMFENVTSIELPESLEVIGDGAFYGCNSLNSITIGAEVKDIGNDAFYGCLSDVEYDNDGVFYLESMPDENGETVYYLMKADVSQIQGSYTVKDNTVVVCSRAFAGASLTSVTIPDSVLCISSQAFEENYDLSTISIGQNICRIGYSAIPTESCENITEETDGDFEDYGYYLESRTDGSGKTVKYLIEGADTWSDFRILDGTTVVAENALKDKGITNIIIPESVKHFGGKKEEYSYIYGLEKITLLGNNEIYTSKINGVETYALIEKETSKVIIGGNDVVLAEGIKIIGENAFLSSEGICTNGLIIPDSVVMIEEYAFYDFLTNTDIKIGSGVKHIGGNAFWHSIYLEGENSQMVIPSHIEEIYLDSISSNRVNTLVYENKDIKIDRGYDGRLEIRNVFTKATEATQERGDDYWSQGAYYYDDETYEEISATVYYYSETQKDGNYWHYVDGIATKWN